MNAFQNDRDFQNNAKASGIYIPLRAEPLGLVTSLHGTARHGTKTSARAPQLAEPSCGTVENLESGTFQRNWLT